LLNVTQLLGIDVDTRGLAMGKRKDVPLEGARALVTGAGSGIGRAVALELARRGTRVLAVDLHADTAEKTAAACAETGPEAHGLLCDVADLDAVTALAGDVHDRFGPLDVLVNNAGVGMSGRFTEMSMDDWRWIRGVNLDGVVHCCHAFGPAMVERGHGHVVIVSSGLGYTMHATEPAYVATKAAVLALSQCLRADWGSAGVGVSAVCPGVIDTPIVDATRYIGTRAESEERTRRLFSRGHPPELVARDVVVAIQKDRVMVPSGWEAKAAWWAHRLLPLRVHQALARRDV
jgi:NAD(P)-dependent dehydrogenase (short-subunit alcohol dehydrogenase family)